MHKQQLKASNTKNKSHTKKQSTSKSPKSHPKHRSTLRNSRRHNSTTTIPTTHGGNQGRPLRIAHLTDLHYFSKQPPTLSQLLSKRLAGYANLVLFNRRRHFNDEARHNTLQQIDQMQPDMIICSGDLTSTALDAEFDEAYKSLKPLTEKYPFFLIQGNHDVYTKQNEDQMSIAQRFSNFMHTVFPTKLRALQSAAPDSRPKSTTSPNAVTKELGPQGFLATTKDNLTSPELQQKYPELSFFLSKTTKAQTGESYSMVIGLNPCRADNFSSTGKYPESQLKQLAELFNEDESSSLLFLDAKTGKKVKPFIILATHYPVIDRTGADYTMQHPSHGATNNHQLLSVLDNAFIKPGLILHGHDHLGSGTGIVTKRMVTKNTDISTTINAPKPPKVEVHVPWLGEAILVNMADNIKPYKWKYDATTNHPIIPFNIPTVKDIVHAYSNTYNTETAQHLQQHLVNNLVEQHGAERARENVINSTFKQMDLVSGLNIMENNYTVTHQHGSYFHTSAPLKLNEYLAGKLKPFGVSTYVPKKYVQNQPQFYDEVSKMAHVDRIKKKEKMLTDYYAQNPQHRNVQTTIQEEADDLARREERDSCVVDLAKQTDMAPNLASDVVIPVHNPGSAALSGIYSRDLDDWPKFASFNMYTVAPRHTPLPRGKDAGQGYVTGDYFTLGVQHCIQNHDLEFPKSGSDTGTPYTFPLRL